MAGVHETHLLSDNASIAEIIYSVNHNSEDVDLAHNLSDASWQLSTAFLIFSMQAGFAMLESGMVPVRFSVNVLMKTMLNVAWASLGFFATGWALGFNEQDDHPFAGHTEFFLNGLHEYGAPEWFFQLAVATTMATLVSCAVAGRMRFTFYMVLSLYLAAVVYPIGARWNWHYNGWLRTRDFLDYSGAGPLHVVGGTAGVLCSALLGARQGVFTAKGAYIPIRASPTNVVTGSLLLLVGWFTLNASAGHLHEAWLHELGGLAISAVNSALSAAGGLVAATMVLLYRSGGETVDVFESMVCLQAGLVSISAGCANVHPYEAVIIGMVGALLCMVGMRLMAHLRIDDPAGIFGSQVLAGIWALVAAGVFSHALDGVPISSDGLLRGGGLHLLGIELLGALVYVAWAVAAVWPFIWLMDTYVMAVRMPVQDEMIGSDTIEHGVVTVSRSNQLAAQLTRRAMYGGAGGGLHSISECRYSTGDVELDMSEMVASPRGSKRESEVLASLQRYFPRERQSLQLSPGMAAGLTLTVTEEGGGECPGWEGEGEGEGEGEEAAATTTTSPVRIEISAAGAEGEGKKRVEIVEEGGELPPAVVPVKRVMGRSRATTVSSVCDSEYSAHSGTHGASANEILLAPEEMAITIAILDALHEMEGEAGGDGKAAGMSEEELRSRRPSALARRINALSGHFTQQMTGGTKDEGKRRKRGRRIRDRVGGGVGDGKSKDANRLSPGDALGGV